MFFSHLGEMSRSDRGVFFPKSIFLDDPANIILVLCIAWY